MSIQTPQQEIAERVAEAAPGLAAAAHAEAVQNLRRMNHDYRNRLADSHRWQAESLGKTATSSEEGDMGNLVVCGDIYGSDAAKILSSLQGISPTPVASPPVVQQPPAPIQQPPPPIAGGVILPAEQPSTKQGLSTLAKALIVAAGLSGAGGLGAAAAKYFTPAFVPDEQSIGVDVVPGGALEQGQ